MVGLITRSGSCGRPVSLIWSTDGGFLTVSASGNHSEGSSTRRSLVWLPIEHGRGCWVMIQLWTLEAGKAADLHTLWISHGRDWDHPDFFPDAVSWSSSDAFSALLDIE